MEAAMETNAPPVIILTAATEIDFKRKWMS
jgi:hypothetical protein